MFNFLPISDVFILVSLPLKLPLAKHKRKKGNFKKVNFIYARFSTLFTPFAKCNFKKLHYIYTGFRTLFTLFANCVECKNSAETSVNVVQLFKNTFCKECRESAETSVNVVQFFKITFYSFIFCKWQFEREGT